MLHVGFTGTQLGMTVKQYLALRDLWLPRANQDVTVHLGDCIGADTEAYWLATDELNWYRVGHIPDNDSKRAFLDYDELREPRPYLERNRDIVDESVRLFATPNEHRDRLRGGTWSTVRHARRLGIPIYIVLPDGTYRIENA